MTTKQDILQNQKNIKEAAGVIANTILEQPMGCYVLPEIFGPNRQLFTEEMVNIIQWKSGQNLETVLAVEMALAGDLTKLPQRLTCRLYNKLYFEKTIRERLPEDYLMQFSNIYQRLITTLTTTVTDRDAKVNETESVTDARHGQQAGGNIGLEAGGAAAKVSYNYDTSVSNAMRERRRRENVVEKQSQATYNPPQDAEIVNTLNDLINKLASFPLGLYFNHVEKTWKMIGEVIEREDWLTKWYKNFKSGCVMAFIEWLLIIPRLLLKTLYNIGQMLAKISFVFKRGVGKRHVRVLFIIHGLDIASPQAALVSAQLDDLVSNQNAVFVIFAR